MTNFALTNGESPTHPLGPAGTGHKTYVLVCRFAYVTGALLRTVLCVRMHTQSFKNQYQGCFSLFPKISITRLKSGNTIHITDKLQAVDREKPHSIQLTIPCTKQSTAADWEAGGIVLETSSIPSQVLARMAYWTCRRIWTVRIHLALKLNLGCS